MRIKLLRSRAGAVMQAAGDEIDRPDHIAIRMIQDGEAVPVSEVKIERAVKAPAETRKRKK